MGPPVAARPPQRPLVSHWKEKNAIDFHSLASTAASMLTSSAATRLMLTSCVASFPGQLAEV